ncbi:hypothetical protein MSZK_37660 [Mycobacterium sp. shizuoka-1]|nr:hypothetical protein MSZK_37660 [Mycobacterium sp. shizuoka-1]
MARCAMVSTDSVMLVTRLTQVFQFFADGIAATVLLAYGNEDSLVDLGCRDGGLGEDTEGGPSD